MAYNRAKKKFGIDPSRDVIAPVCIFCIHLKTWLEEHTCAAFPEGIPDEIWIEANEHRKPFPGDNRILFERRR
jgi:hypothetical protein